MGVDYTAVSGIGIEFTDKMIDRAIDLCAFTREDFDEDNSWAIDKMCQKLDGVCYQEAGSYGYGGDQKFYLIVEGSTLNEINGNAAGFISVIRSEIGADICLADLILVDDMHVW